MELWEVVRISQAFEGEKAAIFAYFKNKFHYSDIRSQAIAKCIAGIKFCIQLNPEFCQILLQYLTSDCITVMVEYLYSKQKRT
jgi:hypothetical protein